MPFNCPLIRPNVVPINLSSKLLTCSHCDRIQNFIAFARIFGFEVDFQRDIRRGDKFELMFERFLDDRNKKIKTGKILYAYLDVNNQKIKLYRFGKKNNYDFYD